MIIDIDLSGVTVLIIDDSRYARSFVRSALHFFGLRNILEAGDAASAVEILNEHPVSLILVDHDMEPIDGIALTRLIRAGEVPAAREVPIIMISGAAERERVVEARNVGVTEFLAKPISTNSLFRRVRNALVNPRPFIDGADYAGPCRRTAERPPPDGIERRTAPALPKPPPLVAMPAAAGAPRPKPARTGRKRFKAGTIIFHEGEAGDEAYVVETGTITIFKEIGGAKVPLGRLGPHGVFGEMALIDDEPRMASAEAAEDAVCLVIPKAALKAQIERTPDLVILVLETLLQDIRKLGRDLVTARAAMKSRN